MAQQTIDLGSAPNDGTGDTPRDAGEKINENFTELYAANTALPETIRDTIGAALVAGSAITITPNDGGDTITIACSITQYTDEMARDALGTALVAGNGITLTVNDGGDTITVAAVSRTLLRSALPFVIPSSGTIGNNGALTALSTALPTTLGPSFSYFPANAIFAGSAAGWYYTNWTGTAAATIYQETYTNGTPAAPVSPTAWATTGPGAYTQNVAAAKQGPTYTMAGGTLGANGKLRFEGNLLITNNANAKTMALRAGAANLPGSISAASLLGLAFRGQVKARGATNLQHGNVWTSGGSAAQVNGTFTAVDMTASQDLNVALHIGTATDYMVLTDFEIIQEA